MDCLMNAWQENELPLRKWLLSKTGEPSRVDDLLQDLFIKALQDKERYCRIEDAKSWLFKMAKNSLIDQHRKSLLEMGEIAEENINAPIVNLQHCLKKVLLELDDDDRHIIDSCDMNGMQQAEFASLNGLSLSATKSRIQRARSKLRDQLVSSCAVKFEGETICCSKAKQSNDI
ncbi:MAG: sigma-70 family RNA polymerase sigma factor [Psychromonas sp.]|nr:sigma-70 family RNA polymerase sigma factor [Psychromonas sp.]